MIIFWLFFFYNISKTLSKEKGINAFHNPFENIITDLNNRKSHNHQVNLSCSRDIVVGDDLLQISILFKEYTFSLVQSSEKHWLSTKYFISSSFFMNDSSKKCSATSFTESLFSSFNNFSRGTTLMWMWHSIGYLYIFKRYGSKYLSRESVYVRNSRSCESASENEIWGTLSVVGAELHREVIHIGVTSLLAVVQLLLPRDHRREHTETRAAKPVEWGKRTC